jgi:hypothetical protein
MSSSCSSAAATSGPGPGSDTPTGELTPCALCGFRYDAAGMGCKASCPMGGCAVVTCPRCGYGAPKEGVLATGLRKLFVALGSKRRAA